MAIYTTQEHWRKLLGSRSVKVITGVWIAVSAADGVIGFIRGGQISWLDVRDALNKVPGNPWIWGLGITIIALIALVSAIFHETRKIVQATMDDHETETDNLKGAHAEVLKSKQEAHDAALQKEQE